MIRNIYSNNDISKNCLLENIVYFNLFYCSTLKLFQNIGFNSPSIIL